MDADIVRQCKLRREGLEKYLASKKCDLLETKK